MWIVALALRRPYTFVVVALLLLILGPIVIYRTPTDIFPNINIPVVSIIWNYSGLNSQDMSNRIVTLTERTLTTTVDDIEHSESQSLNGIAVVKVFFQPNANISKAIAQITAISDAVAPVATRDDAATGDHIQRLHGADSAASLVGTEAFGTATLRLRRELYPHAAGDDSRRRHSLPVRWKTAASAGGSRHQCAAGERPVAAGCGQRHQRSEPDSAFGDL
jgi:hypothetical protein